jgi:hypothetical protein
MTMARSHAEEEGLSTVPTPPARRRAQPSSDAALATVRCLPSRHCRPPPRFASGETEREREATRREGGSRLMCEMRHWQRTTAAALGRWVSASTTGWWWAWGRCGLVRETGAGIGRRKEKRKKEMKKEERKKEKERKR